MRAALRTSSSASRAAYGWSPLTWLAALASGTES